MKSDSNKMREHFHIRLYGNIDYNDLYLTVIKTGRSFSLLYSWNQISSILTNNCSCKFGCFFFCYCVTTCYHFLLSDSIWKIRDGCCAVSMYIYSLTIHLWEKNTYISINYKQNISNLITHSSVFVLHLIEPRGVIYIGQEAQLISKWAIVFGQYLLLSLQVFAYVLGPQ